MDNHRDAAADLLVIFAITGDLAGARTSWPGWGSPGPWRKPSPTTWTGTKSPRSYTAAAGRGSP